ncbi:MAG: DUF2147 domain-containing protein [Candidatus Obscuribacterales bacterium]|nr:DUF2147 domain-containing protein [Steroidobacteraceae bacterium]
MNSNIVRGVLVLLAVLIAQASFAQDAKQKSEAGRWVTESGNLEVDIAPCGKALCGTVVQVLGNRSMSSPQATMQAADTRPALGMQILSDLVPDNDGEWSGHIYNRENAKTYDCYMKLVAPDQLKIRAYKFLPLFGKTQIWKRVQIANPTAQ